VDRVASAVAVERIARVEQDDMHVLTASNITPAGAPNVNGPCDLSIALIAIGTVSLIPYTEVFAA
jgi:hypothetical protein